MANENAMTSWKRDYKKHRVGECPILVYLMARFTCFLSIVTQALEIMKLALMGSH